VDNLKLGDIDIKFVGNHRQYIIVDNKFKKIGGSDWNSKV